ncbi:MAG: hypothetical protein PVF74_08605 [Anaerolineales bacterium]|jgi:hypothetical protein
MNIKRSISFLLAGVIVAVLLLCMALPANAKATRIEVASFEYDCANGFEKDWMAGQVYHIRNYVHTNRNVSDFPELNGINYTVGDGDFNLLNGVTVIRGTLSFKPDTINGTWEGTWTFISNPGITRGYAVAQGTGDLFGKTLFLNLYDAPPTPDDEAMCEGLGVWEGNVITEGYILDTSTP